jgi:PDZ domain-containing protein
MRMRCLIALAYLGLASLAYPQQAPSNYIPLPQNGQIALMPNSGASGLTVKKAPGGFQVTKVWPGSPAESAGLHENDIISAVDGKTLASLQMADFYSLLPSSPGQVVDIDYSRGSQVGHVKLTMSSRSAVYHQAANAMAVEQPICGGRAMVTAAISPFNTESVLVYVGLSSDNCPAFVPDDAKFFILDGNGQQLNRETLDQIKYGVQLYVAQNWRDGVYPPPTPPPPTERYTIGTDTSGNYTVTPWGENNYNISGTSQSTSTVTAQPDYSQQAGYMLGYSIGTAIRRHRDKNYDKKLLAQAQQVIGSWDRTYFQANSPLIPGENRQGDILYWSRPGGSAVGPFKLMLFLTNPDTGKQEVVSFKFQ